MKTLKLVLYTASLVVFNWSCDGARAELTVTWTAPFDDCGTDGTPAAVYEMVATRDSALAVVAKATDLVGGFCPAPDSALGVGRPSVEAAAPGLTWFTSGDGIMPYPAAGGSIETATLPLAGGTWWLMVRATDAAGNIAPWSAPRRFEVDVIAPAAIFDLH